MLLESCTEIGDSSVQKAGVDVHGRGQVTFQESRGSMMQSQLQPHDRDKLYGVSVCLSVCIQMSFRFGEWGLGEGEA